MGRLTREKESLLKAYRRFQIMVGSAKISNGILKQKNNEMRIKCENTKRESNIHKGTIFVFSCFMFMIKYECAM